MFKILRYCIRGKLRIFYSYEDLLEMRKSGIKLDGDSFTKYQLEKLFVDERICNNLIAELYDISPNKVRAKRKKWNINLYSSKYMYRKYKEENSTLFEKLNSSSIDCLLKVENIDWLSKALTHYIFRNGPIEDTHALG